MTPIYKQLRQSTQESIAGPWQMRAFMSTTEKHELQESKLKDTGSRKPKYTLDIYISLNIVCLGYNFF